VSTIQGNFLSVGVQEEVKKFLRDPNRGRPKPQLFSTYIDSDDGTDVVDLDQSYIDLERHADEEMDMGGGKAGRSRRTLEDAEGKCVDVVLSDMSAPWEQTSGFWKRSLSNPYIRMMNTSGINFKDHAGSMVSPSKCRIEVGCMLILHLGSLRSCSTVCARDLTIWGSFCVQVLSRGGGQAVRGAVKEDVWLCAQGEA
jgi:23S rRNA U2552 (ribose-2'-O)-methylase RlmE/FtsJ